MTESKKLSRLQAEAKLNGGRCFGATSCPECVKTFPQFVALAKRIGPEKLACISLSLDFEGVGKPEDRLPDVQKFLSERGATFE